MSIKRIEKRPLKKTGPDFRDRLNEETMRANKLEGDAIKDALTGCANRAYLEKELIPQLNRELDRSKTEKEKANESKLDVTILFIDLNNFKTINDTKGHEKGDEILKACAKLMETKTQAKDRVIRLGGDEFLIVVRAGVDGGISVAKRLVENLNEVKKDLGVEVGFSIGIKEVSAEDKDIDGAIRAADGAMYAAKQVCHDPQQKLSSRFEVFASMSQQMQVEMVRATMERGSSD